MALRTLSTIVTVALVFSSVSIYAHQPRLIGFLQGESSYDHLGYHSAGIGDINGDGLGDFIVCQDRNPEKMMIYLGGPQPFDNPPVLTIFDYNDPTYVGDVDGDGVGDFVAVGPGDDTLRLYLGLERLDGDDFLEIHVDDTVDWDFEDYRASWGGDNNGDGRFDFWVSRKLFLYDTIYGYTSGDMLDTIPDFRIFQSPDPGNWYQGQSRVICTNCDLNGDSLPEIIYGQYTPPYSGYPGRVCVVWGAENLSSTPDLMFHAPGMGAIDDYWFGSELACMGDISGDGIDDLWVNQGGRSYIYYGGRPFDTIVDIGLDYHWTDRVEMIGDINNDGYNDIMLLYTQADYSQIAFMYCGPGMDTLVDRRFNEVEIGETVDTVPGSVRKVGVSFSWVGDVDGDDIVDILVGADVGGSENGWMFVLGGWDEPMSVEGEGEVPVRPAEYVLSQNYPNPFNSATVIEYTIPKSGNIKVTIYDILGRQVTTLVDGWKPAGAYKASWDGCDDSGHMMPSGIYFYHLKSDGVSQTKKMILLK